MAGEPQGNEFTIGLRANIQEFAPLGAEFTIALESDIYEFAPLGAEFTINAPPLLPPDAPTLTDIEATQLTVGVPEGKTQVTLNWTAPSGTIDNYELYRIPGNLPVPSGSSRSTVLGEPGVVTVDTSISSTANSYVEELASTENGKDWTYYLFATNPSGPSDSDAVLVETLTGIPQNLSLLQGDGTKTLMWTGSLGTNADGVNVYRSKFAWSANDAIKLNVNPESGSSFVDGPGNANRVSEATAEYPQNGFTYAYRVESTDSTTSWTDGTSNEVAGGSADTVASKTEP